MTTDKTTWARNRALVRRFSSRSKRPTYNNERLEVNELFDVLTCSLCRPKQSVSWCHSLWMKISKVQTQRHHFVEQGEYKQILYNATLQERKLPVSFRQLMVLAASIQLLQQWPLFPWRSWRIMVIFTWIFLFLFPRGGSGGFTWTHVNVWLDQLRVRDRGCVTSCNTLDEIVPLDSLFSAI